VVNLAKVVDIDLREISIELSEAFLKSHCKKIRNNWGLSLIIPTERRLRSSLLHLFSSL